MALHLKATVWLIGCIALHSATCRCILVLYNSMGAQKNIFPIFFSCKLLCKNKIGIVYKYFRNKTLFKKYEYASQ